MSSTFQEVFIYNVYGDLGWERHGLLEDRNNMEGKERDGKKYLYSLHMKMEWGIEREYIFLVFLLGF